VQSVTVNGITIALAGGVYAYSDALGAFSFDPSTGDYTYTAGGGGTGSFVFAVTVADSFGGSSTSNITIDVGASPLPAAAFAGEPDAADAAGAGYAGASMAMTFSLVEADGADAGNAAGGPDLKALTDPFPQEGGSAGSFFSVDGYDDNADQYVSTVENLFLSAGDNHIFVWESGNLGGSDTIANFDFNYERNSEGGLEALDGMSNAKIQFNVKDLLGPEDNLASMLQGLSGADGTFSYGTDQGSFTAGFSECGRELLLTLEGNDIQQSIIVQSDNIFHDNAQEMGAEEAAAILQQILLCSSGAC
jgi:hypothetical protein